MNLGQFRPKLIATDLDGTIVHHDGTITERTLKTFARARDLGISIWLLPDARHAGWERLKKLSVTAMQSAVTVQ